jgi:hypothetical protein
MRGESPKNGGLEAAFALERRFVVLVWTFVAGYRDLLLCRDRAHGATVG